LRAAHGRQASCDLHMLQVRLSPPPVGRRLSEGLLSLYARLGLPCSIDGITAETYKRARDEIVVHRDGLLRAPLPSSIGGCEYADDMSDDEIDKAFARLQAFMLTHPQTSWNPTKSFATDAAAADQAAIIPAAAHSAP